MVTNSESGGTGRSSGELLAGVRIVLVGTTHPGNIGASARAMKAMGLSQLYLVSPKIFPSADATAMASGADDILARARVVGSLETAIDGCAMVFGTTARDRHLSWPVLSPAAAAETLGVIVPDGPVAVVFGREQSGLSNAELDLCQRAIRIPTEPTFNSLNLSQAVQICAYEVRKAIAGSGAVALTEPEETRDRLANVTELDRLYQHLLSTMTAVGYFDPENPKLLERRVRRLVNGAGMRQSEAQILRGFLAAVERKIADPPAGAGYKD